MIVVLLVSKVGEVGKNKSVFFAIRWRFEPKYGWNVVGKTQQFGNDGIAAADET